MSKQVNYPYQTTTLSAKGSAEVIARGITNDYITTWSYDTTTIGSWDRVATFPTVVRTGNFVWCWYREYDNRAIYVLIDVVPDPQEEYQLGNNIAYPALLNGSVGEIQYPVLPTYVKMVGDDGKDPMIDTLITDGPYYPLTVGNKNIHVANTTVGYKAGFWHSNRSYKEIVADKWGRTPNVWGGFATSNGANIPWMVGWGTRVWPLTNANGKFNDSIYGLFAPFATYEQFQTLYGAEKDWIFRTYEESNSPYKTLFGPTYDTTNNAAVQYTNTADIENDYPFTVAAMQPQIKYRDVPGDTTGDGLDDTPSYEDTLTALAVVAAVVPGLDPTKCEGFPGDIKIPGIATDGISEKLKELKAAVASAASSAGLLDIEKRLEGFKDRLLDSLPKGAQIQNLAADIASLDPSNFNAIDIINEKWKGAVDNVTSYLDNILDIDICSLIGLKGKTAADGSLVKKPELPAVPVKAIEVPEQSKYVPIPSKATPQDEAQATTGYTPKKAEAAREKYNEAWKKVRDNGSYSVLIRNMETYQKDVDDLRNTPNYQKILEMINNKKDPDLDLLAGMEMFEEKYLPHLYQAKWITKAVADAQKQITHKLLSTDSTVIKPGDNPLSYWTPHEILDIGSKYPDGVAARMQDYDYEYIDVTLKDKLLNEIEHQIFNEDILSAVEIIKVGLPSEYKSKDTYKQDSDELPQGGPGDGTGVLPAGVEGTMLPQIEDVDVSLSSSTTTTSTSYVTNQTNTSSVAGDTGDPADDSIGPAISEEFKFVTKGKVSYNYSTGTIRNQAIQPALFKILEASAAEKDYSIVIYSGGQDFAGRGTRRIGGKRHDGGYAADVRVYNDKGRRIHAASTSSRDIAALREFVLILLKNGIGSVGADSDYMNGNLHLDIAHLGPYKYAKACWGASGSSYRRKYAPQWLSSAFDNRV